jgi:cyclopropane fatty-acyl-phospholipid synthase-like methyltransferase
MAWYQEMFAREDPLRAELYAESESSRAQVDFVIDKLALQPGARVLDLCCGQGRHLIDLARRGYDAVGVDLSEYQLGKCREAAAQEGLQPNVIHADMREIGFDSEFDAVISMYTSFGYLESDEEDRRVLAAVARALKPGGRFLVDIMNRDRMMNVFKDNSWEENSRGDLILAQRAFDSRTGRIHCREIAIHADGGRSERSHSIRLYTYGELERTLNSVAMQIESAWGGFDSSEFHRLASRMIIISRKGGTVT